MSNNTQRWTQKSLSSFVQGLLTITSPLSISRLWEDFHLNLPREMHLYSNIHKKWSFKEKSTKQVFNSMAFNRHVSPLRCSLCKKICKRTSEHLLPNSNPSLQMCHRHQQQACRAVEKPAWLFLSRLFLSGVGGLGLCSSVFPS